MTKGRATAALALVAAIMIAIALMLVGGPGQARKVGRFVCAKLSGNLHHGNADPIGEIAGLHEGGVVHHGAGGIVITRADHIAECDDDIGLGYLLEHDFAIVNNDFGGNKPAALRNAIRLGLHHVLAGFNGGLRQKGRAENKPLAASAGHQHFKVRHVTFLP